MPIRASFLVVAVLAAGCTPLPDAGAVSDPRADAFEARRLALSGFVPLENQLAESLEVQRIDYMFELYGSPAVEITKERNGEVLLSLLYWGHKDSTKLSVERWDQLARIAGSHLVPSKESKQRRRARVVHRCHSWHTIETAIAGRTQRIVATPCAGDLHAQALAYADLIALTAVQNLARCAPWRADQNLEHALESCGESLGRPTPDYLRLRETSASDFLKPQ
jgi:hypothetical protein